MIFGGEYSYKGILFKGKTELDNYHDESGNAVNEKPIVDITIIRDNNNILIVKFTHPDGAKYNIEFNEYIE